MSLKQEYLKLFDVPITYLYIFLAFYPSLYLYVECQNKIFFLYCTYVCPTYLSAPYKNALDSIWNSYIYSFEICFTISYIFGPEEIEPIVYSFQYKQIKMLKILCNLV